MTSPTLLDLGMQAVRPAAPGLPTLVQRQGAEVIAFRLGDEPGSFSNLKLLSRESCMGSHKQAIIAESRRLQQSRTLVQSSRLRRFLSFAVEATLNGDADSVKEYTIGVEAYERRPDFDPGQDSIVRTEARRLRKKLEKYYREEGSDDPIIVEFQPGSYVPMFYARGAGDRLTTEKPSKPASLPKYDVAVAPFSNLSGDPLGEACALGLTEDFVHRLTKVDGINVFTKVADSCNNTTSGSMNQHSRSILMSEGSVRTEGKRIRVTSRLHDATGLQIESWQFDAEVSVDRLFSSLEKIASELVACMDDYRKSLTHP